MKKAGAVGLAVVLSGIILVGGLPVVAHAASASLADLTAGASSSYNSVMAKLAASGFLQAFSLVFVSEIGDKTFFIAGALVAGLCGGRAAGHRPAAESCVLTQLTRRTHAHTPTGLLAMKTSRLISFTGSMAALTVMTILSVLIGQVRAHTRHGAGSP